VEPVGSEGVGGQGSGRCPDSVGTGGAVVRTGRLMGGPQQFCIFPNYPNWLKLEIENGCLTLLEKFPKFAC
jgi:hypothetical protein